MIELKGKVAFHGYAIGKIIEYKKAAGEIRRISIEDTEEEIRRFRIACEKAIIELRELYDKVVVELGEANAAIFDIHQLMIQDEDYLESVHNIIHKQKVNAEYAVAVTGDNFAQMFSTMSDAYMKERAADVKDISERLIRCLDQRQAQKNRLQEAGIIIAEDLAPSETVQLDKDKVLAFVTKKGSIHSHTAILARTMNIPALVNVNVPDNIEGLLGIVDGEKGIFIIEPQETLTLKYEKKQIIAQEKIDLLANYKGKEARTKSGKLIKLYANIGGINDIGAVLQNDGEGIGLFRSEFLYLEHEYYPSEEEQFQVYKKMAEMMGEKPVVIRTLDIGADKQIDYFNLEKEVNPALGYRAIRICLDRIDMFKVQIRALLRASAFGNISILIPMITSEWEIIKVQEIIEEVKHSLVQMEIEVSTVEVGIMIETPAAVIIADELAKHVDFFSIGSNDLTQYTLAVDRQNAKLESYFDPAHPAILRMIKMVIDSAHRHNIWVGICGEIGAELALIEQFIQWGIDELSVAPSRILHVKEKIIQCE